MVRLSDGLDATFLIQRWSVPAASVPEGQNVKRQGSRPVVNEVPNAAKKETTNACNLRALAGLANARLLGKESQRFANVSSHNSRGLGSILRPPSGHLLNLV